MLLNHSTQDILLSMQLVGLEFTAPWLESKYLLVIVPCSTKAKASGIGRSCICLVDVMSHFPFVNWEFLTTTDKCGSAEHRNAWYQQIISNEEM